MSLKEDICVFFSTNTHLEEPPKNPILATIFCKKKKKKKSEYPRKRLIDPRDETKGKVKTLQFHVNVCLVFVCKEILKKK